MTIADLFERATTGWRAPALLAGGGAGAIGAALFMQLVVGVQPCVLCIYQRIPYVLVGVLGLAALVFGRHRTVRVVLLGLIVVAMLVDCGIALFHVGIEHHFWQGTPGCGVPAPAASVEALRAQLLDGPVVRCDEVSWSLFGISLAGYNILITLAMAGFAAVATLRATQPRRRPVDAA